MDNAEIVEVKNISKVYPGVKALDDVSVSFRSGEVHALIGENGAGKSTLMKIISGAEIQTSGEIYIDGEKIESINPKKAIELGIGTVYQEFNLFPELTVVENLFLGKEISKGLTLCNKVMLEKARLIIDDLGVELSLNAKIKNLSVAYQQIVEICKILLFDSKILIMDEPTAPLTNSEVEVLFSIIEKLKQKNVAIIYVSHRMEEIFKISDRITVLRDGNLIDTIKTKSTNREELIRLMVGRNIQDVYPSHEKKFGEVVLEVRDLSILGELDKIRFKARKGEILGIAGLVGAGRTELARAIFGADNIMSGQIEINGKPVKIRSPKDAVRAGIGLVTEDRKKYGLILDEDIIRNITITSINKYSKLTYILKKEERNQVDKLVANLQIKTPSINQSVTNLSGGNQQKVVLAKWIDSGADILILDEPTRGIDVNAKQEIYKLMCNMVEKGKTILMISSDMPELLGMSDRIIVMSEGRIKGEMQKEDATQERVLQLASK